MSGSEYTMLSLLPRQGAGRQRFLMWIIAFMTYVAALAMIGAFMVGNVIDSWRSMVGGVATVVIPAPAGVTDDAQRVADGILAVDGVAAVRRIPDAELNLLLAPWLPDPAHRDLPLPQVIEVVLGDADHNAVADAVNALAPAAELTAHEQPVAGLLRMGGSIQAVGALVVLVVLAAAIGTVVFTTRASLVIHRRLIDIVHMMGATDGNLARPFRERAMVRGLVGGLTGVGGAIATLVVVVAVVETDVIGLSRAAMTGWQWLAVVAIPAVFALIPMATAHMTVLHNLSRLP